MVVLAGSSGSMEGCGEARWCRAMWRWVGGKDGTGTEEMTGWEGVREAGGGWRVERKTELGRGMAGRKMMTGRTGWLRGVCLESGWVWGREAGGACREGCMTGLGRWAARERAEEKRRSTRRAGRGMGGGGMGNW